MNTYGIRWQELKGREGRVTTKEREFKTDAARAKFAEKISEGDNFYGIVAYSDPRPVVEAV